MKELRLLIASAMLSSFVLYPAIASANDDDLEVTMDVVDDISDIDGVIIDVRAFSTEDGDGEGADIDGQGDGDHESGGDGDHEGGDDTRILFSQEW